MAVTKDDEARFAQCRALGHMWRHTVSPTVTTDTAGIGAQSASFYSRCTTCRTVRVKWISRSGALGWKSTRYEYPEGYQRQGDDRLSATEWRSAFMVTVLGPVKSNGKKG